MRYLPSDGTWTVSPTAAGLSQVRDSLGEAVYEGQKKSLQTFLCAYFSTGHCDTKQGASISPLGATPAGGKILKVRWGLPGQGKSGGLRLCVVAYCDELRVTIAEAFVRKDNPSDAALEQATKDLP